MISLKNDIRVLFNEDRQTIENGESWTYTDSLNISKVLDQKHGEVLKRIRKVLKDYGLEDEDSTKVLKTLVTQDKSASQSQEFVNRHTDFTYAISNYKDAKGESRPYYKLSKDLLVLVMFSFSRLEKAKQFQLGYIAEFNRKEKELQWHRARYMGIDTRNSLTDNVKEYLEDAKWWDYANFTNLVYISLYGMDCKEIINRFGLVKKGKKKPNVRAFLSEEALEQVKKMEAEISTFLIHGMDYEAISNMFNKTYEGKAQELMLKDITDGEES